MPLIRLKSSSFIDSVNLRGIPTASDTNSGIATTQQVQQAVSNLVGSAPAVLDTLGKLAQSLGTDNKQA
jgi:hypothetical protein